LRGVQKNIFHRESGARLTYLYEPLIGKVAALKSAGRQFMNKMFDGAPAAMISFFIRSGELSPSDIREICRLIEEMKHE